jgi:hypothetical protein
MFSAVMSTIHVYSCNTFYFYAECRYAECRYAECRYAECRYAECRYAECRGVSRSLHIYVNNW